MVIEAYTDGSCSISTGDGGWGAVILQDDDYQEICGGTKHTTSNRMELTAVIKTLEYVTANYGDPLEVRIYSDSLYVVNAFNKNWIKLWRKKSFRNIKNSDLWLKLLNLTNSHIVEYHWVKGHNGTVLNERADELAAIGRTNLLTIDSKKEGDESPSLV